ncbi:hypothetical protein [Rhodohalobacter halophilus]|uniref:hypothetical protein n=1 Tax=Rhodohalobacter halophilus TaxID=1812810 RepID=UPI00159F03A2|nr:hypothetical protein [Rhodohalobacter halophilus]
MTEINKKRLMFVKGEDFYFMSYNTFLLLDILNCKSSDKVFKDYKKLSFLIDFVSNPLLTEILSNSKSKHNLSIYDKELLNEAYGNGVTRMAHFKRLLFSLEKKEFIGLVKNQKRNTIDIYLNPEGDINFLRNEEIFYIERKNAEIVKSSIPRLTILKLENVLSNLFNNFGITTWPIS